MDLTLDPRESANAAVTNLFYMVNMMHDVTTTLGFNEEFAISNKKIIRTRRMVMIMFSLRHSMVLPHEAGTDKDANGNPTKINNANFSNALLMDLMVECKCIYGIIAVVQYR